MNRVILIGHLGQDPEMKQLGSGRTMATFRVATSERWNDKGTGEKMERTEWHRVVVWGKTAERVGQYLSKGRQVCVEGRIQTRKWSDKDGADRTTTEVVATAVTFLGGRKDREAA